MQFSANSGVDLRGFDLFRHDLKETFFLFAEPNLQNFAVRKSKTCKIVQCTSQKLAISCSLASKNLQNLAVRKL